MSDKTNSVLAIAAGAIPAYRFVKLDAVDPTKAAEAGATELALGVALAPAAADGDELLVGIDGYALVDFGGTVQPYTEVEVGADGKAVAAATPGAFIPGYYCPEPVDGAVSQIDAGARGRIVIYNYKGRIA
jgi:hypothetical protein